MKDNAHFGRKNLERAKKANKKERRKKVLK
jgi:hypothetical protein